MPRSYQELRSALQSHPTSFPEVHAVAEMRPISQTIHLHQPSHAAFMEHKERRANIGQLRPHVETYLHEVMHWYDLVGSLWGAQFLDQVYVCLDICKSRPNTAEGEFYKLVDLFDEERRIMFPRYYHLVMNEEREHSPRTPWRIQFSFGLEFDAYGHQNPERPVFFVRFSDHQTDELIARQPLTVGALLETRAIASERHTAIELMVADSSSEAEFLTQAAICGRENSEIHYDRELTLYTVAAHLLTYSVGTKEAMLTYAYAAALANVALNMTNAHFEALRHPDKFEDFGEQRLEAFRRSRNRGYAFSAIAVQADQYDPEVSLPQWLDAALEHAGLPIYAEFSEQARDALATRTPMDLEVDSLLEARQELETAGQEFFDAMTAKGIHWVTLKNLTEQGLPIPFAFDCEGHLFSFGKAPEMEAYQPELFLELEWKLMRFSDNFLAGARGN